MYKNLIICAMAMCSSICGTSVLIINHLDTPVQIRIDGVVTDLGKGSSWTSRPDWSSGQVSGTFKGLEDWTLRIDTMGNTFFSTIENVGGLYPKKEAGDKPKQDETISLVLIRPTGIDYALTDSKGKTRTISFNF